MVYVNNIQINFKLQINCKTSYHSYTEIFDKKIKIDKQNDVNLLRKLEKGLK